MLWNERLTEWFDANVILNESANFENIDAK